MNPTAILSKSKSWPDFRKHLRSLNNKQKGDCFETLVLTHLQLNPEYITVLKKVWKIKDVPSNVRKRLNLPGPDEGIDLIGETRYGAYWAIQCKYREDELKSLTRKELSTFTDLAFSICKSIELGLVCTNTERYSHKLTLYGERLSFCSSDVWRSLDEEFFKRLHRLLAGKLLCPQKARPRKHQSIAIRNTHKHFIAESNSRGKLIAPCGTGKSLTGYWIAEELAAKKILVSVPSLALVRQTLQVWTKEAIANNKNIRWIAVCSDESDGAIERDDISVLTQDLGIRVHTDPDEIASWLKAQRDGMTVVFTTYQSGKATAAAARKAGFAFDLGIFDEAHKTVGKKVSLFSHLLYDKNIKITKRVFMTATERQYRGQSDAIASMDDPGIYGETFDLLSFKKALESKPPILSDYKIVTISVTRQEMSELVKKNLLVKPDKGRWDQEVEAEMLAAAVALRKAMKKYPIHHAVSFHGSIARAKLFKEVQEGFSRAFPSFGRLDTFHVSGSTPTAVRSRELAEFADAGRSLVTNARCLTEGVDVPKIDCVLFADPRRSTIDIVQAVGRALRIYQGKKFGYVVVPVLLDDNIKDIMDNKSSAFESILMVLRALAANDERIVEYFRTISHGKKWSGKNIPVDIDIPEGLKIDADEFIDSIRLNIWSRIAKLSWRPFEEAREFMRGLKLKSTPEWFEYSKDGLVRVGKKPLDIPSHPHVIYKNNGWISYGDWLGTGRIADQFKEYMQFKKARTFVRALNLESQPDWRKYCKGKLKDKLSKPDNIPFNPNQSYENKGWISWGDWLGTGYVAHKDRKYRSYEQSRDFVHRLGLRTGADWVAYCQGKIKRNMKKPADIPQKPDRVYKDNGWISMGD